MGQGDYDEWRAALSRVAKDAAHYDVAVLASKPAPVRWLIAMSVVEGQVFNGGFHQVYFNRLDRFMPDALEGYRAIGAALHAELVQRVMESVARDPYTGPPDIWPTPERPAAWHGDDIGIYDEAWYTLDDSMLDAAKAVLIRKYPLMFC